MIYVTGDLHGEIERFHAKPFKKLKKNDYLIVCGDFGFLWDGSKKEEKMLKWIGKRRYHVLFIEGTHDNLDLLHQYPVSEWNGAMVRTICGNLKHVCRGSILHIDDRTIFLFGGGESTDIEGREMRWWEKELPTRQEIDTAKQRLAGCNNTVDYIITHQSSYRIKQFLTEKDEEPHMLDIFFNELRETSQYRRWFFGSYHINKCIPPKDMALYDAVVPVEAEKV